MNQDLILSILSLVALAGWGYLALFHGKFWQLLMEGPLPLAPQTWPSVDIIVPARNEAAILANTLPSLLAQDYPGAWRVLLVDDHSMDSTITKAQNIAKDCGKTDRLNAFTAPDLPEGWTGKVAAMQAGMEQSQSDYILFTDADIWHAPDSLQRLMRRSLADHLDLHSWMVQLNCASVAEKLLVPAFVFFFAMLYPFRRANNPKSRVAAAAGGVMLVRKQALQNIGGLSRIKSALIDDCSLAAAIKHDGGDHSLGGHIRLTLTTHAKSLRPNPNFASLWRMVARTAFTQLNHSVLWLAGTILGMLCLFVAPVLLSLVGTFYVTEAGVVCWIIMVCLYGPMVRFYGLPFIWSFTLPLAACLYLGATLDSARRFWMGKGGQWKNRIQAKKQ